MFNLVLQKNPSHFIFFATSSFQYLEFKPLPHGHIVKMAVFIEKPPVTSSNCYETMKNASILIKLGTTVDWTIAFVTTCSVLNFLLPWQ
jgi:hypothetical protein